MFLEPSTQDESGFRPRDGVSRAIRATAAWATDAVLAGMVAAGLGIEALCFYLSVSRTDLLTRVAVLGLPSPPDRPLRRSSRTGWTPEDVRQLAELWALSVRAAVIADVLGRSVGAVYGQRRRLGLPARDRRGPAELSAGEIAGRQAEVRAAAHAHGQTWPRPRRQRRQLELPFADFGERAAEIESQGASASPNRPKDPVLVDAIHRLDGMWTVEQRKESRMSSAQTEIAIELSLRALAGQHPRAIGAAMGMTYSAVVNRVSRLGIKNGRRQLVDEFDPSKAFEYLASKNLELRTCHGLKRLFFARRAGDVYCNEWSKKSEVLKRGLREAGVRRERTRFDDKWRDRLDDERAQACVTGKKAFCDQWDLFEKELNEALA